MQLMPCDLFTLDHPGLGGSIESLYATNYTSTRFINVIWMMYDGLESCGDLIERDDRARCGGLNLIEDNT